MTSVMTLDDRFDATWPLERTARELVRDDAGVAPRLSVVGLVRLDEVIALRVARGIDRDTAEDWVDLHRAWMAERFGSEDLVSAFAKLPPLRAVSELRIDGSWIGVPGVAEVLASPLLAHLHELELTASIHPIDAYEPLARRPLEDLRRFALTRPDSQDGDIPVGDDLITLLARSGFTRLESLTLPRARVGPAGLTRIFELPALTHVGLAGSRIGDDGCRALARAPSLSHLRSLDLEGCLGFDENGAAAAPGDGFVELLSSPRLAVTQLGLRDVPGAAALVAGSPAASALEYLALEGVDDEALALLVASRHLRSLRHLRLYGAKLSDAGLAALGRSRLLADLESLVLCNDVAAPQEDLFAKRLPRLRGLALVANHTTGDALRRADVPSLTDLHLDLLEMQMSEDDEIASTDPEDVVDALLASGGTPRLCRVVTSYLPAGVEAELVARFGAGFRVR